MITHSSSLDVCRLSFQEDPRVTRPSSAHRALAFPQPGLSDQLLRRTDHRQPDLRDEGFANQPLKQECSLYRSLRLPARSLGPRLPADVDFFDFADGFFKGSREVLSIAVPVHDSASGTDNGPKHDSVVRRLRPLESHRVKKLAVLAGNKRHDARTASVRRIPSSDKHVANIVSINVRTIV